MFKVKINDTKKLAYTWATTDAKNINLNSEYYCKTRDIFQARLEKLKNILSEDDRFNKNAMILTAILGEIGNNAFDHNLGNWRNIMGIFFIPNIEKKEIAIVDRGQGLLKTLQRVKPDLKNHEEALKTAFTERISGRAPEQRGNGLKFTKENIKNSKMHLSFITGNAEAKLNQKMVIQGIDFNINGCMAILEI